MSTQQITVPYRKGYDIGIGADLLSGGPLALAVTGTPSGVEGAGGASVNFTLQRIHSTSDLERALGVDVDASYGSASFGAGVSDRFSFAETSQVQTSSLFMTLSVTVQLEFLQLDSPVLTADAAGLVDRPDQFEGRYGNVFVRGIQRGGVFVGVLRIDTRTSEDTEQISNTLKGSYGLFSAEAKTTFSETLKQYQSEVFVQMYHEGGPTNLKITDPTDPVQLLDNANAFLQSFQDSPAVVARPYEVTLAPMAVAIGPPPLNAADIQHAQDVLVFCAHRRSAVLDNLNLMQFMVDHASKYDYPAGSSPALVQAAVSGFQSDLDLIAQAASSAINSPAAAAMPADYAAAHAVTFPKGQLPTVLPVPKAGTELGIELPIWDTIDYVMNGGTISNGGRDVLVPSAAALGLSVIVAHADHPGSYEPGDRTGEVMSVLPLHPLPGSTVTVTIAN